MIHTTTLRSTFTLPVTPEDAYQLWMDPKQHAHFTGYPARISSKVGGRFSVSGDYATGKNMQLVPGKKIVQTWRASDWPAGHYAELTLTFTRTKQGTRCVFVQTGVPTEFASDIRSGWKTYYWTPLKEYAKTLV